MIKVIIADDEQKVCASIRRLVDWSSFHMEVVGTAHDGLDALALCQHHRPDVVITDIRMPGLDGLELIAAIQKINPDTQFIIISGYNYFDYAKTAIQLSVCNYMLKPVKQEEFVATLETVAQKFHAQSTATASTQAMCETLRNTFFASLTDSTPPTITWAEANEAYGFQFQPGLFQIFAVKLDNCTDSALLDAYFQKLLTFLKPRLQPFVQDWEHLIRQDFLFLLCNLQPESQNGLQHSFQGLLKDYGLHSDFFANVPITLSAGEPCDTLASLPIALNHAIFSINHRLLGGTGTFYQNPYVTEDTSCVDSVLSNFHEQLQKALELYDGTMVRDALYPMSQVLAQGKLHHGQTVLFVLEKLWSIYLSTVQNQQLLTQEDSTSLHQSFSQNLSACATKVSAFQLLEDTICQSYQTILDNRRQQEMAPIRLAKQYIADHYQENITLKDVGDLTGYSATYFSALFKKATDQTFSDYLQEVRIDRAKELLKEENDTISAVCQQVGYSDLKTFTQHFKKITGLKPKEFRKIYA